VELRLGFFFSTIKIEDKYSLRGQVWSVALRVWIIHALDKRRPSYIYDLSLKNYFWDESLTIAN